MYFSRYDDPFMRPRRIPVRRAVNGLNRNTQAVFHSSYDAGAVKQSADTPLPIEDTAPPANHLEDTDTPVKVRVNGSNRISQPETVSTTDEPDWKETAVRLQAEMDNFRKRQTRRADDAIAAERERLLSLFLPVADNLARALASDSDHGDSLRQGVELTNRELTRLLEAEGVTPIETAGQEFDPEWHEAISLIPAEAESGVVISEVETGYKLGDKLLRPAKVVVAA